MIPEYDPSDLAPTTETAAASYQGAVSDSVWTGLALRFNSKAMMGSSVRKYVRSTPQAGDLKNFDCGLAIVCTNNAAGATPIGKLWIEYDFEFFEPQASTILDAVVPTRASYFNKFSSNQLYITAVRANILWDAAAAGFNPLLFAYNAGTGVFTPLRGVYNVRININLFDTVSELQNVFMDPMVNGVAVNGGTRFNMTTGTVNSIIAISAETVLSFNGTDTFAWSILWTAAAGAISLLGPNSTCVFSIV